MNTDKLTKLAQKVIEAGKAETDSCDRSGKPDRYKKAAASRAHNAFIDACTAEGMTLQERIAFLHKVQFGDDSSIVFKK